MRAALVSAGILVLGIGALSVGFRDGDPGPQFGKVYVALFNDLALVKLGEVGMSRVPLYHTASLSHGLPTQNALIRLRQQFKSEDWRVTEGIEEPSPTLEMSKSAFGGDIHVVAPKPGAPPNPRKIVWTSSLPDVVEGGHSRLSAIVSEKFAYRVEDGVKQSGGGIFQCDSDGYHVFAQRIPFQHKECLSCHSTSKLGDTAAVAVFAYKRLSQ